MTRRLYSLIPKTRSILGYAALMAGSLGRWFPNKTERKLNKSLLGYPRNHNYRLCRRKMLPSFRLYERLRAVTALYPESLESFLDLGCCRGYFVLDAASQPECRVATGIDVHQPFVSISNRVSRYLEIPTARFYLDSLEAVSNNPESFGGPFQTVLLLGTYHYLYWGSKLCPDAYHCHRQILSRICKICTGKLIFSGRLEVDRLPSYLREKAQATGKTSVYSKSSFLDSAAEFFEVQQSGYMGKDPLLLMSNKAT